MNQFISYQETDLLNTLLIIRLLCLKQVVLLNNVRYRVNYLK